MEAEFVPTREDDRAEDDKAEDNGAQDAMVELLCPICWELIASPTT